VKACNEQGVEFLTLFAFWELHTDSPMLDIRYFKNPAFSTGTGGMILVFMSLYGMMFLLTQYLQLILGYSPLGTALRLLPLAPVLLVVSPLTGAVKIKPGSVSLPVATDERDLSDRVDRGNP